MKILPLIFAFFLNVFATAQNDTKEIALADELLNTQRYSQAYYAYSQLQIKHPTNAWIKHRLGVLYLASRSQKSKAIPHLEKAIELSGTFIAQPRKSIDAPALAYKLLGDAYLLNHKFDKALKAYSKYKEFASPEKDAFLLEDTEQKIDICKLGKELNDAFTLPDALKNISKKTMRNYTAAVSQDKSSLIYTLKIPLSKLQQPEVDSKYFEEPITTVKRDTTIIKPVNLPGTKKDKTMPDTVINYATVGASSDGQIILTYKTEGENAELYISRLKSNKWTSPVKLARNSNTKGWEPGEFISADGNTMYFVAEKKGGFGGKDIYKCVKLSNGEWSKAVNLGPAINSRYDEVAPFIHADGTTLYYSSNRINPEKGFDIFSAQRIDSNTWSKPVAIGYPVDYIKGESFYEVAADAGSSPTTNTKPLKKVENDSSEEHTIQDNYVISFNDKKYSTLTLLKGKATSPYQSANEIRITVWDNITGNVLGTYYTDETTGEYSFILPSGTNNNILYEAEDCTFASENVIVGKGNEYYQKLNPVMLLPIAESASMTLNNVFFDAMSPTIKPTSKVELQNIIAFAKAHPDLEIKINNYITGGDKREQKKLSKSRAQVVAAHLVVNGISKERIKAQGFYKKMPKPKKKKNKDEEEEKIKEQQLVLQIGKIRKNKTISK